MAKHHDINTGHDMPDDPELHPSYGMPVPPVEGTKGKIVNFGILAGSTSKATPVYPKRNIHFNDSVEDQRKNLPGSH